VLRRLVPAVLLAAACVVVPATTASASPVSSAGVDVRTETSYTAISEVGLPDGRTVQVALSRYRIDNGSWAGYLNVLIPQPCNYPDPCSSPLSAYTDLSASRVRFDRDLGTASVTNIPITLQSGSWAPDGNYTQHETPAVVSATFTGTGTITHSVDHGNVCGSGDPCLFSGRITWTRQANVSVTFDGVTGTGTGVLYADRGIDVNSRAVA
jgi:hypothetical protein